jgi:hypothetical protein
MDRNERARRRALFARPWEAIQRDRSLSHGLELEEEAQQEEAAHQPQRRRRITGRFVATSAITVFAISSLGLAALMADRFQAQAFMRDHGVAAQAIITDKTYTDRPPKGYFRSYYLYFRFLPLPATGRPPPPDAEDHEAVTANQFAATSVGQTVTIRYNPQRLSQSQIYFAPPPTDRQMLLRDLLLSGVWVVLFGGLCAAIVFLAWPNPPPRAERVPEPWAYR